ncbi:hypothetical protein ACHAWF_012386 [Thalassiosira exigua]
MICDDAPSADGNDRKEMSPNSNHLGSYQQCLVHEALSVDGADADSVHVGGAHDADADSLGSSHAGRPGAEGSAPCSYASFLPLWGSSRAAQVALAVVLSFGIGWLSSDVFSTRREGGGSTGHQQQVQDDDDTPPDLIWSDEFDGDSVDLSKWTFVNGNGCDVGLCGWGNNELEWYSPSNARVSDGHLTIEARKLLAPPGGGPVGYTSAKIVSKGKADFGVVDSDSDGGTEKSRRFEARMKLPWGQGIWPAFWMLPTYDAYGGWPKSGEIDIMENIGKEGPNTVHGTVHYGLDWPQHQYSEAGITLPARGSMPSYHPASGNLNETFHTYAVERLPGVMRWYVDDIMYSSVTKEEMKPYRWTFDEDFYFILNLAVGGNWPGNPVDKDDPDGNDATVFPQSLEVDYVRVYEGTFPRIAGKSVVSCSERGVVYEVVNAKDNEGSYTWSVPDYVTIQEGQGTSRVTVNLDYPMLESNIDSAVIHVKATNINDLSVQTSTALARLQEPGIGLRVKIVDLDAQCSSANTTMLVRKYNFDCGRPSACTPYVLSRTTEEFTCGERIEWLINEERKDEIDACHEVGYKQFHGHCGPCNPLVP